MAGERILGADISLRYAEVTGIEITSTPELFTHDVGRNIQIRTPQGSREVDIYSGEGFDILSQLWTRSAWQQQISYECTWLGIPIIQTAEDIVMMQELLWKVRPDVVVECGVAHGGALILYASILHLIGKGHVIGVDVDIRKYNRIAIESHPLSQHVTLLEGSSVDPRVIEQIASRIRPDDSVLVALDSNHAADHVEAELALYAPMVTPSSYIVVFDGVMQILPDAPRGSATWQSANPWTAVERFLQTNDEFEVDSHYNRLKVTHCPGGFLRKVKNRH